MYTHILTKKYSIIAVFLFLGVTLFLTSLFVYQMKQRYSETVTRLITQQQQELSTLTQLAMHDGTNAHIDAVIQDCPLESRVAFDEKLSLLEKQRGAELEEIEYLFNACGDFYAVRNAVLVLQLESALKTYTDLRLIGEGITPKDVQDTYAQDALVWQNLVQLQKQKSTLALHLVAVQGDIISALKKGTPVTSDTMQSLLVDGQKTKEEILRLQKQTQDLIATVQLYENI